MKIPFIVPLVVWTIASAHGLVAANEQSKLSYLTEGQIIKVEGTRFEDGNLVADKIKLILDDDDLQIEGPLSSFNKQTGEVTLGYFVLRVDGRTRFENIQRHAIGVEELETGLRVRVKLKRLVGGTYRVRTVRLYRDSKDRDFEVVGPIEGLDLDKSELTLLSRKFKVTSKTDYPEKIEDLEEIHFSDSTGGSRQIRRDDDEPDLAAIHIGNVYLGGKIGFTHELSRNLDPQDEDPVNRIRPSAQLEVSVPLAKFVEAYTKINVNRTFDFEDNLDNNGDLLVFRDAFLYVDGFIHPSLALQIGRQRFRDEREWIYDERLDAVRLHFNRAKLRAELGVAKTIFGETGSRSDQLYLIARSEYRLSGRRYLAGYFIKRNDVTARDEDPIWFGLSSRGRITGRLQYWTELSRMMGRRRNNLLRGYAYDVGGSYRFKLRLRPTISAGYAFGSGDDNLNDGIDGNFRQTRLNDNTYRIGGLRRYNYYGVLSEPELSNIKILTLDLGVGASKRWSLDFIYHTYRQAVARKKTGKLELGLRPRGKNPNLGREFDMVFSFRRQRQFDFSIFTGLFLPGPAFEGGGERAFVFRPVLRYFF